MSCRELGLGQNELNELFRRAVFNIIGRNQDDHAKNFGFMMDRDGTWSLSPAFDMTYAYDPYGKWTAQHQISLSGKRDQFERNDLLAFASKCSIPAKHANEIIEQSLETFSSFTRLAKEHEVPNELYKQVFTSLRVKSF
jgi:serine/threonine-protein kinase HipA